MADIPQLTDVPSRVKYSLDTPVDDVDRDRIIDAVYQAQVDLQLVAHWLATQPKPVILFGALQSLHIFPPNPGGLHAQRGAALRG